MASGPITSWQIDGDTVTQYILGPRIPADGDCSHEIKRHLLLWKRYNQARQHIKKQRHYFANKGPSSQSCGFSSSHVWMWELDYKESWARDNWCFWTVVLKKTFESPLDCREIQRVHPRGNQFWIFGGRTDAEAETPKIWPPDVTSCLIWKDPGAGKDCRWEQKGSTEDETVGWLQQLNGHEFEYSPGGGGEREGLACCSPSITKSWTQLSDWAELSLIPRHMDAKFSQHFFGDILFATLNGLTTFVKNCLTICVKVLLGSEFFFIDL